MKPLSVRCGLKTSPAGSFIVSIGLFLLVFCFYLYTLAPSLNWADAARMQMDVMLGGSSYAYLEEVSHLATDGLPFDRLGVAAWDHPLYVMVGHLFAQLPIGEPLYRINLLSALAGALAISLLFFLGEYLIRNHWAVLLGALALAVSHTFWFHSVTSEVYTLNILLFICLLGLALYWLQKKDWRILIGFSLVGGLGLANHRLFVLPLVTAVAYMIKTWIVAKAGSSRVKDLFSLKLWKGWVKTLWGWPVLIVVIAFLVGFAPWWVQFGRMARLLGVGPTLEMATTFKLIESRLASGSWEGLVRNLALYLAWLTYQFTPLGVGLGAYGFLRMRGQRPLLFWFLIAMLGIHIAFSANFSVADQFNFHLPSYTIFALGMMWGAAELQRILKNKISHGSALLDGLFQIGFLVFTVLAAPALYVITPALLRQLGVSEATVGIYPIGTGVRDTLGYFLNPNKRGDDSAAIFGRSTLERLAPQAIVLTPKTSEQEAYVILRYFQKVEGLRPDVRLDMLLFGPSDDMPATVLMLIRQQIGCRPIYLSSLNPVSFPATELYEEFKLVPEANLYRVLPRQPAPADLACPDLEANVGRVSLNELIQRALRWK